MKTIIAVFTCFLLYGNVYSQSWFSDDHKWVYKYFAPFSTEGYGEMRVAGDTVIDGQQAKVLITDYTAIEVSSSDSVFFTDQKIVYEEDSRVYLFTEFDYPELLYDFNLEVGDSLTYRIRDNTGFCADTIVYHLDSLSTVTLNNKELVVQHFSFYDMGWDYEGTTTLMESVGRISRSGNQLDHRTRHICAFDLAGDWLCTFSDGAEELKILDEDCYELPIILGTDATEDLHGKVYPNPATDQIFIENYSLISKVQLYTIQGNLLYDRKPKLSLDVSELPPGSYLVRLSDHDGHYSWKILTKN